MPKVHTIKKARKDHLDSEGNILIPKGSTYYWWKFRYSPKRKSLTYPTPAQLDKYHGTRMSEQWEELKNRVQESIDSENFDNDLLDELRDFVEQEDEKIENIPEIFEYSYQSETMRERRDEAQELLDNYEELESQTECH